MSIINDALKKVQQNRHGDEKQKQGPGSAPLKRTQKEKFSRIAIAIIFTSFLGSLAILAANTILTLPKQKTVDPKLAMQENDLAQSQKSLIASTPSLNPLTSKEAQPENQILGLTLNGIIQMGDEYSALINNKIVRQGDSLGSRKIISIGKDHVKVFDRGETLTLKLKGL